ncbi:MAG: hypothetical protein SPD90_02365 [Intestinibacter sp.]|uniref:hypothetical protein n=1 Tax=Intestinibacter sp. TaxID=1965304 RepID=UPI002A801256|nr:hypothetical protein [Intestinibacter sp.]MDY4573884.1 hypothetical protein [Intestinibacter sp.]
MNKDIKQYFIKIAHFSEILLSMVILLVIFLGICDILREIYAAYIIDFAHPVNYDQLNDFLAQILLLVIGVELVIMLCLHLPETLLEVLLYAIARKLLLVPKTAGVADLLLGVLAIAGIFFIKKYLMPKKGETLNKEEERAIRDYLRRRIKDYDKEDKNDNKKVISEENN